MTDIYVTDAGFALYEAADSYITLSVEDAPETYYETFRTIEEVFIPFVSSADGRGFSIARALRHLGYEGRIIAVGALVSDQYRHARQSGFDGVLITKAQAAKMPESHWLEQAQRVATTYSARIYA